MTYRAAVFWQCFGPYHFARVAALRQYALGWEVIQIEVSKASSTYRWERQETSYEVVTLFPSEIAEVVSPMRIFRHLRRVLRDREIAVVFVPSYWPTYALAGVLAARSLGLRVVMMNDSHLLTGNNSLFRLALKRQLVGLFDSALVAGRLHRTFFRQLGMPNDRIFEGYDTVDNTYFSTKADEARGDEEAWRKRLGLPAKFILSLGRFVKKKNLEFVLNAYAQARVSGHLGGHDLVFVGDGPEKGRLVALARRLDLPVVDTTEEGLNGGRRKEDRLTEDGGRAAERGAERGAVYFLPFAQIDTVPAFYALASCFVLASKTDEWGLVVNEAMASGCPVVVSRFVGCAPDLVVPGVTGYRFNPDSAVELAWRFGQLCGDEAGRVQMGLAARAHIAHWSNEQFAQNAFLAAEAALRPRRVTEPEEVGRDTPASVTLLQTCFPDYREPVFDELSLRLGDRFALVTGRNYFTTGITPCPEFKEWHTPVTNRFLAFRHTLWQHGVVDRVGNADIVVLELNPRILSNWVILAARRLAGSPTLLWGHIWGRQGMASWTNIVRLMMMRLADGVIPYSHSQAKELRRFLPEKPISVAPNSLIPRSRCTPALAARFEDVTDIVFVGRLIGEKKTGLLLRAFLRIADKLPAAVRLVFVGAGGEAEKLREEAGASVHVSRVFFYGHVREDELLRGIYARSFCSVSPGYVGLSAVQSFAFGVPMVIADREPHAPEIELCHAGENCVFFRAGDVDALGMALLEMWRDRERWYARRGDISAYVAQNYSTEAMVDGFVAAIAEMGDRFGQEEPKPVRVAAPIPG